MEKQKSIKQNMFMSAILTSSNFIFPLITYAYVARVLLPEGVGKVVFAQSILAYFGYIATLGISGYGMRECAKVREDKQVFSKLVQELLMINCLSTIIAYIALVVMMTTVQKIHSYIPLLVIMSTNMFLQTIGMEWLYQALENYTYITMRSLLFKTISVILTFLLIKKTDDYIIYGGLTVFTSSASYILNFYNARKYIYIKKYDNYKPWIHLKPIMVFFMSSMIITIYSYFDSTMLGFMKGDAEVGIYSAAMKMKTIVISLSSGVTAVLVPRMSLFVGKKQRELFLSLLTKSLRVSLILVFPIVIFVLMNARNILIFICGKEYLAAEMTLIVLIICVLVLCMTNLFGNQVLIPKGMEKCYSISVFIGMFINLGLNFILIPRYASVGAAVATLVTECFNMIYMGAHCKMEAKYLRNNIGVFKYIVAMGIAIMVELIAKEFTTSLPRFLLLCINVTVLLGSYEITLFLMKEPIIMSLLNQFKRKLKRE